jgi:hypothetical protein
MSGSTEHLAKEADRLKHDEIFNKAMDDIRSEALVALAEANADNYTAIVRLQQKVAVVNEIRTTLDRYIIAADVQEQPGSFA